MNSWLQKYESLTSILKINYPLFWNTCCSMIQLIFHINNDHFQPEDSRFLKNFIILVLLFSITNEKLISKEKKITVCMSILYAAIFKGKIV